MDVSQTSQLNHEIGVAVGKMYDIFYYPRYPLFVKLRWQEGYIGASGLAQRLFHSYLSSEGKAGKSAPSICPINQGLNILVAGCGEVQPYIIRKLEPPSNSLDCIDLSSTNIRRACIRLLPSLKQARLTATDIDRFLEGTQLCYDHIDCYGVLHHLASPSETIRRLSGRLKPFGSMRIMVYNSKARSWIRDIKQAFSLLALDPYQSRDRGIARELLGLLGKVSPPLREKLNFLGRRTLKNDSRLVDTFFHKREVWFDVLKWFELFDKANLFCYGLFDRYGELDDLKNPLWYPPSPALLAKRIADGTFENNLELFLCHKAPSEEMQNLVVPGQDHVGFPGGTTVGAAKGPRRGGSGLPGYGKEGGALSKLLPRDLFDRILARLKPPPISWFSYSETCAISYHLRYLLWHSHIDYLYQGRREVSLGAIKKIPGTALQRLARLGAILPDQVLSGELKNLMGGPP